MLSPKEESKLFNSKRTKVKTLPIGNSDAFLVPEGQALNVNCAGGTTGVVSIFNDATGAYDIVHLLTAGQQPQFGPYLGDKALQVTVSAGSATVTLAAADVRAAIVALVGGPNIDDVVTAAPGAGYTLPGGGQFYVNGVATGPSNATTYTRTSGSVNSDLTFVPASYTYTAFGGTANPAKPGAPTIGLAFAGANKFQQNFTAPASDGGSAITNYQLFVYNATTGALVGIANGTASPLILEGVPVGVKLVGQVRAQNISGPGDFSALSNNNAVAVAANTYMMASNRFGLNIDWGSNDTNFANGSDPRAGGNGTSLYLFARRRLTFTTGSWAPKAGSFLWSNASNTVNGVIDSLFPVTIQRAEVRKFSDLSLTSVVRFGGAASVVIAPGAKVRNDGVDLLPNTKYCIDYWYNSPAHSSFPVGRPLYLAGESSSESMTDQSGSPMPASGFGNALLGYFEPSDFVAQGWDGSPCWEVFGDSITDGTFVCAPLATARGDLGQVTGALGDPTGNSWNYHTTAKASSSFFATYLNGLNGTTGINLIDWYADATFSTLGQILPTFSAVWCAHGRNNASSTVTLALMQSYFNAFADKLLSRYPSLQNKIVQQATTPVVTNTANYFGTSLATQTATGSNSDPGNNGILRQWNNWVAAGCGGRAKGLDTPSVVRDATEYAKWAVPSFSALTTAATTANTSNVLQIDTNPPLGTTLVIEAGDPVNADGNNTARLYGVAAVAANGPNFDCTMNSRQWGYALPPGASFASRIAKVHAIGAPVVATGSQDGLHPVMSGTIAMMNYNIAAKPAVAIYLAA